jgi:hypothetical protein
MQNDDKHIIAEKWVDEALKTPPAFKLSDNFAERCCSKSCKAFCMGAVFPGVFGLP